MLAAALAGASFSCYSAIRGCALLGLKTANFHASSACHDKRADKFGTAPRGDRGHSSKGYGHKAYLNYMKRKKRAAEKRDLLKWRSCEIHIRNFEELYWSCGNYRKWLNRNNRDGYEYTCYEKRSWSKKEKKSAQPKQGPARKRAFKEEFNFFWQRPGFSPFWDDMFSDYNQFTYNFFSGKDQRNNFSKNESNYSGSSARSSTGSSSEDQYSEKKNVNKEPPTVGSPSDRKILGLPPYGFLSIEELKKAFRAAALRWHPDRHEAGSKVDAEAKFKACGAAYKSLLAALLAKS